MAGIDTADEESSGGAAKAGRTTGPAQAPVG